MNETYSGFLESTQTFSILNIYDCSRKKDK